MTASCLLLVALAPLSPMQIVIVPPDPFLVSAVPLVPILTPSAPAQMPQTPANTTANDRRYPPTAPGKRVSVREKHYVPVGTDVKEYLASQKSNYGPEVDEVIRDIFLVDAELKSVPKDGEKKSNPENKSKPESGVEDLLKEAKPDSKVKIPGPEAADPKNKKPAIPNPAAERSNEGKSNPPASSTEGKKAEGEAGKSAQYPPKSAESTEAGADKSALTAAIKLVEGSVVSKRGGTPLAEMALYFVDLDGQHHDANAQTDGLGKFRAKLEPSHWQCYLKLDDGSMRKLGMFTIDPVKNEPLQLQY